MLRSGRIFCLVLFLSAGSTAVADVDAGLEAGGDGVYTTTPFLRNYGARVRVGGNAHLSPLGIQLLDFEGTASKTQYNNSTNSYEIRAHGSLLYAFRLQDLLYRASTVRGDETRVLGGIGLSMRKRLSKTASLAVSASVGVFFMNVLPAMSESSINYGGAYAGGDIAFRIRRFKNSLRVSAYRAMSEGESLTSITWDGDHVADSIKGSADAVWQGVQNSKTRYLVDEEARLVLFDLPLISLEPGVRVELAQLPLGSEVNVLLGVSGRIGR